MRNVEMQPCPGLLSLGSSVSGLTLGANRILSYWTELGLCLPKHNPAPGKFSVDPLIASVSLVSQHEGYNQVLVKQSHSLSCVSDTFSSLLATGSSDQSRGIRSGAEGGIDW